MNDHKTTVHELKQFVEVFIQERDWHQFHNPKNLSMQIAAEAAELMEHFLWIDGPQSVEKLQNDGEEIRQEIADVAIGVLLLCAENGIDLADAIEKKMALNAQRYPVEKAKGRSEKYNKL